MSITNVAQVLERRFPGARTAQILDIIGIIHGVRQSTDNEIFEYQHSLALERLKLEAKVAGP